MAAGKKTSEPEIELDDETQYSVTMVKKTEVGRLTLQRGSTPILKGKIIKGIRDRVSDILPIAG